MVKSFEGVQNAGKHGEVNLTMCVVPIKVEAKVAFAASVTRYFVVNLEGGHEMVGVCFADVFYVKIFDTEGEKIGRHLCIHRPGVRSLL